jgi:hypothetical protein
MYSDPTLIRKHKVKLSLSDREQALLDALCAYTGEQKATLLREMLLERALDVLHGDANSGVGLQQLRGAHQSAIAA